MHLVIASLALSAALATPPNLLINGGFEQPLNDQGLGFYTTIPGWTLAEGTHFELWWNYSGPAAEGRQNLELDGHQPITLHQDVNVLPGRGYVIRFAFSPRAGTEDNRLEVLWNGVSLDVLSANGVGLTGTNWTYHEYPVAATGATARLTFRALDIPDTYGTLLDAVSITRAFCPGDVNGDFVVNFFDLNAVLAVFGSHLGEILYIPQADLNADGAIDFLDLNIVLSYFGDIC